MNHVVINGAGPIGLTCALALAQKGFQVTILDKSDLRCENPSSSDVTDIRVFAISHASEKLLRQLNVWQAIENCRVSAYQHMTVWDATSDGIIHFNAPDFYEENLGHIIEQKVIVGALYNALHQLEQVEIKPAVTINEIITQNKTVQLRLSDATLLECALVIGCDGKNSGLRQLLNLSSDEKDYHQTALVATVEGTQEHYQTAFQSFNAKASLALLPLSNPYQASIVWALPRDEVSTLLAMDRELLAKKLFQDSDGVMGTLNFVSDVHAFQLNAHHVKKYWLGRCVLLGDAAHTIHPLAGQGVNLGFLDVAALVETLSNQQIQGQDIGDQKVLKQYESQRRYHNQAMLWAMTLFKEGFTQSNPLVQWLRNQGLNWVDKQPIIKQYFAQIALGKWDPIPKLLKRTSTWVTG